MANTKLTYKHASAAVVAMALAGCGGSSGVSSGYPPVVALVGNPTGPGVNGGSSMAPLTGGRTFQYAVSGTITKDYLDASNTRQTVSGQVTNATLTRVVTNIGTTEGGTTFQFSDTLTYTLQGMPPSVEVNTWRVNQAADNSLQLVGIDKFGYLTATTTSGDPIAPATFSTTANLSGTSPLSYNLSNFVIDIPPPSGTTGKTDVFYTLTPGSGTVQTAMTALGQESVPTTKGADYTAWKTVTSETESWTNNGLYLIFANEQPLAPGTVILSNSTKSSVDDWVPSLGAPVRSHITLSETDQEELSYQLTSPSFTAAPAITYTFAPNLTKKETLDAVLTSSH